MNLISKYKKDNRFYLMPTINLLSKNKKKIIEENGFYYNWLDED